MIQAIERLDFEDGFRQGCPGGPLRLFQCLHKAVVHIRALKLVWPWVRFGIIPVNLSISTQQRRLPASKRGCIP